MSSSERVELESWIVWGPKRRVFEANNVAYPDCLRDRPLLSLLWIRGPCFGELQLQRFYDSVTSMGRERVSFGGEG